jgi:hypothetical protein
MVSVHVLDCVRGSTWRNEGVAIAGRRTVTGQWSGSVASFWCWKPSLQLSYHKGEECSVSSDPMGYGADRNTLRHGKEGTREALSSKPTHCTCVNCALRTATATKQVPVMLLIAVTMTWGDELELWELAALVTINYKKGDDVYVFLRSGTPRYM